MTHSTKFSVLSSILILSAIATAQTSRTSVEAAVNQLLAVQQYAQTVISPDGASVAWVEEAPAGGSAIYVAAVNSPSSRRKVAAGGAGMATAEGHVVWSANSKQIAFLSDADMHGQLQLYVADAQPSAKPRKLTSLTGFLDHPAWSPDGRTIAILFTENSPRAAGPLVAMTVETGVIESRIYEQRLTLVDAATGQARQISPPDMYVYEFDWSPDGKNFAVTAARGEGDSQWYVAQLYTLAASGGAMKSIYKPKLQLAVPKWSPDGKSIAFIGGIMSDEGSTGGDIFVVPASGGEARNLTPNLHASPTWLKWLDSGRIVFVQRADGMFGIAHLDVASGTITSVWSGAEVLNANDDRVSFSADGKMSAVIRHSFSQAPEVWAGPIGSWSQVTHNNAQQKPNWGEARGIHWITDDAQVQGWLLLPKDYDPKLRYPMVVLVHGGPGGSNDAAWPEAFFSPAVLSGEGYFIFYPNPRGSFGQGESFTAANVKDFGYGDFRDILGGVDQVVKEFPVDNGRIGITGWSYGGYMTMWAVTQTQRFKAAVAGAGLSNWQSYYGENDIDEWMIPFFGASVYDDAAVYAKSSPMNFIQNVKTPTLVLVGDRDGEVPEPQSREFWHALKTRGVETQFVIYPAEGHHIAQPDHQRDIVVRMAAWFDKYLKAK